MLFDWYCTETWILITGLSLSFVRTNSLNNHVSLRLLGEFNHVSYRGVPYKPYSVYFTIRGRGRDILWARGAGRSRIKPTPSRCFSQMYFALNGPWRDWRLKYFCLPSYKSYTVVLHKLGVVQDTRAIGTLWSVGCADEVWRQELDNFLHKSPVTLKRAEKKWANCNVKGQRQESAVRKV